MRISSLPAKFNARRITNVLYTQLRLLSVESTVGNTYDSGFMGPETEIRPGPVLASKNIAPWYPVPSRQIVSVEHPCIINNLDNGLKMLGGDKPLGELVNGHCEGGLGLFLRPEDPMSRPIMSQAVITNNVVLKVVVPRRTGRKRKRGTSEPFRTEGEDRARVGTSNGDGSSLAECRGSLSRQDDPGYLFQSLRDNPSRYRVEAVGTVAKTHRYRALTDFQHSTTNSRFVNHLKSTFFDYDYQKMKDFKFGPDRGVKQNTELIPPPHMTKMVQPFNYSYLQNPAVKLTLDPSGIPTLTNTQMAQKVLTHMLSYDSTPVPTGPPAGLPPLSTHDPRTLKAVQEIRRHLDERPMWTRRALSNKFSYPEAVLKPAWQYAGYMFRSGPWKESLVKFGVDPRTDPSYRIYQTVSLQIMMNDQDKDTRKWEEERKKFKRMTRGKQRDTESHIFDGRKICLDGKVWQVCDITDPLLKNFLATTAIRSTCDVRSDGWYTDSVWTKVKTIMKEKSRTILAGRIPSDVDYAKMLEVPDSSDNGARASVLARAAPALAREAREDEEGAVQRAEAIRTKAALAHAGRRDRILNASAAKMRRDVTFAEEDEGGVGGAADGGGAIGKGAGRRKRDDGSGLGFGSVGRRAVGAEKGLGDGARANPSSIEDEDDEEDEYEIEDDDDDEEEEEEDDEDDDDEGEDDDEDEEEDEDDEPPKGVPQKRRRL